MSRLTLTESSFDAIYKRLFRTRNDKVDLLDRVLLQYSVCLHSQEHELTFDRIAKATSPPKSSEGIDTETTLSPNWVPPLPEGRGKGEEKVRG